MTQDGNTTDFVQRGGLTLKCLCRTTSKSAWPNIYLQLEGLSSQTGISHCSTAKQRFDNNIFHHRKFMFIEDSNFRRMEHYPFSHSFGVLLRILFTCMYYTIHTYR